MQEKELCVNVSVEVKKRERQLANQTFPAKRTNLNTTQNT